MIDSSAKYKAHQVSYLLMAFALPLTPFFSSLALGFFILMNLWLALSDRSAFRPEFLLLSIPWALQFFTLGYAYDSQDALAFLLRQSPMLLVPLLLAFNWERAKQYQSRLRTAFYAGLFISCLISLIVGAIHAISARDIGAMQYYALAEVLSMHPTYFSLYLVTGLGLLLFDKRVDSRFWALLGSIFLLTLGFLQSRMALIIVVLLIAGRVLSGKGRRAARELIPVLGLFMLILLVFPGISERGKDLFIEAGASEKLIGTTRETGVSQRAWLWEEAVERIIQQPWRGYGVRSQRSLFQWQVHRDALKENHSSQYMEAAWYVASLNFHNQFLQWTYEGGIFFLILAATSMIGLLAIAWRQRNWKFLLCYLIFICFLCSENLLDRQLGIYFYSFFLAAILAGNAGEKDI